MDNSKLYTASKVEKNYADVFYSLMWGLLLGKARRDDSSNIQPNELPILLNDLWSQLIKWVAYNEEHLIVESTGAPSVPCKDVPCKDYIWKHIGIDMHTFCYGTVEWWNAQSPEKIVAAHTVFLHAFCSIYSIAVAIFNTCENDRLYKVVNVIGARFDDTFLDKKPINFLRESSGHLHELMNVARREEASTSTR